MLPAERDRWSGIGQHVIDRRLRLQLAIFLLVFLIVSAVIGIHLIRFGPHPFWGVAGFVAGLAVGYLLTRTTALGWDAPRHVVAGSMTALGIVVLIIYFVFAVLVRDRIIGSLVEDADTVTFFGVTMTAGVMLGRLLVTLRRIQRILALVGVSTRPR